jgi:hypothetical protein
MSHVVKEASVVDQLRPQPDGVSRRANLCRLAGPPAGATQSSPGPLPNATCSTTGRVICTLPAGVTIPLPPTPDSGPFMPPGLQMIPGLSAMPVVAQAGLGAPPAPTGGAVAPDDYQLVAVTVYGPASAEHRGVAACGRQHRRRDPCVVRHVQHRLRRRVVGRRAWELRGKRVRQARSVRDPAGRGGRPGRCRRHLGRLDAVFGHAGSCAPAVPAAMSGQVGSVELHLRGSRQG